MRNLLYMLVDVLSAAVVAVPVMWLFQRFSGERGARRYVLSALLTLYLCEMFNVVGIPAVQYIRWEPNISLIPFCDGTRWLGVQRLLNAVMFLPLGFLLPLLWKHFRNWKKPLLWGFGLSLVIELSQLFCFRATDVDDLIMNTLGAGIGYFLAWLCFRKPWGREEAEPGSRFPEAVCALACIGIPYLTIVFLRTPIADWVYGLPMFD